MSISRVEFLHRTGIDGETLDVWIEEEWLVVSNADPRRPFTEADLARAHFIEDLISDLGVNHEGVGVVLHLLDQVHELRRIIVSRVGSESAEGRSG
ncbi:MAG: chaperone modulator CbpM [Alphaproteobacteria bacterium]